ncbi:MAG: alpha-glucosidase/alpha-galactosidase [Oscillospiraceae bacterium]|nr:alpha-glucosidase/alpha-galactosidase [Oscillospiraceae bacterium]
MLTFPAFRDAHIALMDIDEERLGYIKKACDKLVELGNYPATVTATTNSAEALKDADGVLCTILAGDVDVWQHDVLIPEKYGVDINVGDTRGPSGIFRALRTIPVMLDICADIEKYCPNAVFLNYTNPMAMLCRAMQEKYPHLKITGLCHSVQGTAEMLAKWVGADPKDVTYTCAGINHQAFYLDLKWNGRDMYPLLREAMNKPEVAESETVRNNMFKHLDYYVTESSGHNSEYVSWYRKRPDLIEKYCHGTCWNPGEHAYILNDYKKRKDTWRDSIKKWLDKPEHSLERGAEYAAYIFNAVFGDNTIFRFNGNVRNFNLISNLPYGCCVEVPVIASKDSLEAVAVGALPDQLAVLINTSARCEELAVQGALEGDPRKVFHAIAFDPLTSAVLSLDEIQSMVDEMFEANKDYLPQFKTLR